MMVLKLALATVVSGLAIWFVSREVRLNDFLSSLQSAKPYLLVIAPFALVLSILARVERWRWLLQINTTESRAALLWSVLLGYFGSSVLPFRLGEVVRAYTARRLADVSVARSLSTIFTEHVLDLGTLLGFLVLLWPAIPNTSLIFRMIKVGSLLFFVLILVVVGLALQHRRIMKIVVWLQEKSPQRSRALNLWRWLEVFIGSFEHLRSSRVLMMAMLWSVIAWALSALFNAFVLMSFDVVPLVPSAVLTVVATNLAALLPSAPGYAGVYEYAFVVSLTPWRVPPTSALAYGLVSHVLLIGTFVVGGVIATLVTGIRWRTLSLGKQLEH